MVPNPILYDIYFDTPNQQAGRFQQEAFFVGAMIHEMAHVASNQLYATNVAPDQPGFEPMHIANMHLPAPVGPLLAGTTVGDNQVYGPGGLDAQVAVMDANWTALEAILLASHDFSTEERALLQRRLDYARVAAPEAHYDTVLADVLFYLRHQHMHETQFYAQATAMLQEANLRRVAGAGTVPHLPVVAVPVPNINTLHQRIGLLINDPLWAEQGEAFIGHKTPDGIRQLRALLQNGGNWRALLIALRDHAAVVALRHSPRRSAVTQQAYNALSMDYRTQGLAPVIAAVNAVIVLL